jgi:uncharacterized protein (DUF2141 family)
MSKSLASIGFAALLATVMPAAAAHATILGEDAAACTAGASDSAVLVRVRGFKARTGALRVQLYGSNPDDFLTRGKKLRRVDLPVTPAGPMVVCIKTPGNGAYAVAVRHYVTGPPKPGFNWNDGAGFSRNPQISLLHLKPRLDDVLIHVNGHAAVDVVLNYRHGLSVGPIEQD